MVQQKPTPKRLHQPTFYWLASLALFTVLSGCRNAAYSDLYVESMAAEIRDLEDQLYEYDNEYHVLEQELAHLKAENEQLRQDPAATPPTGLGRFLAPKSGTAPPTHQQSQPYQQSDVLQFSAREFVPIPAQEQTKSTEQLPPKKVESILEAPGANSGTQNLEGKLPALPSKENPSVPLIPTTPPNSAPGTLPSKAPSKETMPPVDLEIPNIEIGKPAPPGMPVLKSYSGNVPNNLELNLSRIDVPNQLASVSTSRAEMKLGAEKPTDMRIVEIAFHPSLTRAANFDDEPDDDGLYLVLQPKNEQGQLVPIFATLEVAVLDPSREGDGARIGRWSYSAADVKSKFQPIGTNQGIHLTLPWNGPDPAADRVSVWVRYTLPDGRQVVNDKMIFVSGKGSLKTVWVPRSQVDSSVVTASAQQSAPPKPTNDPANIPTENPTNYPTNVVRPSAAIQEPAPVPGISFAPR